MFCPEDGTEIPIGGGIGVRGGQTIYPPCKVCATRWSYDGESGRYEVYHYPGYVKEIPAGPGLEELMQTLRAMGAYHRAWGTDTVVANIIGAMEKKAREEGSCTYYTGTFAVARETLATAGLTCEKDPGWHGAPPDPRLRWASFMGDDYEYLTRRQAIEVLLAERS